MSVDSIDSALCAAVAANAAPGIVAAARLANGQEYHGAFGVRSSLDVAPMTRDTLFWIASMTKLLTTIAALQLVEQGRLILEQPAAELIPAIGESRILDGFDCDGNPRLRRAQTPVTLQHLLTHTSGFGYPWMSADLARYAQHVGAGLNDSLNMPRMFEAGTGWLYGVSTDWVGQLVERASGRDLGSYLKVNVFDRVGMTDTTFSPTGEQLLRKAAVHARHHDGGFIPIDFPPPMRSSALGGGGLYSTPDDYLRLLLALLDGRAALLGARTTQLLTSNQVGDLTCGIIRGSMPALTEDYDPVPGNHKRWTMGLMLTEQRGPNGRGAGSLAWAGLGNCCFWLDPLAGVAGVIMMQVLPFANSAALDVFAKFERAVYSEV